MNRNCVFLQDKGRWSVPEKVYLIHETECKQKTIRLLQSNYIYMLPIHIYSNDENSVLNFGDILSLEAISDDN